MHLTTIEVRLAIAALLLALGAAFLYRLYGSGREAGVAACQADQARLQAQAEVQARADTQAALARGVATGQARERKRQALDTFYSRLETEALHDVAAPVDRCVLPDERLRRWADANRGGFADPGSAAGEPDGAASAAAAAGLGGDSGSGGEPSGGGAGVSPVGGADVQPAGVPAGGR